MRTVPGPDATVGECVRIPPGADQEEQATGLSRKSALENDLTTNATAPSGARRARAWLDARLRDALSAHLRTPSPRYAADGRVLRTDRIHVAALARRVTLLRWIHRAGSRDLLDVGGGFGEFAALVRHRTGHPVFLLDLSPGFLLFARIWRGIVPVCGNAAALPFRKGAFGTVVCSEVVEHLEQPVHAFLEFSRVARESILVSSDQCCHAEWEYALRMATAERDTDFSDRNWFLPGDFELLLGPGTVLRSSLASPRRVHGWKIRDASDLGRLVELLSVDAPFGPGAGGILAVSGGSERPEPPHADLVMQVIEEDREADALFLGAARQTLEAMKDDPASGAELISTKGFACPGCEGTLTVSPSHVECGSCGARYESRWGIPILDPPSLRPLDDALRGIEAPRVQGIRRLSERIENAGQARWAQPFVWALIGLVGFARLPVSPGERIRILRGWFRDALSGTKDPGASE